MRCIMIDSGFFSYDDIIQVKGSRAPADQRKLLQRVVHSGDLTEVHYPFELT